MPDSLPAAETGLRRAVAARRPVALAAAVACALSPVAAFAQDPVDPFAVLRQPRPAQAAPVPPRALAVIPERHTGRLIRVVDELIALEPQFDDLATGAGLDGRRAIQLRTREARIPIFVAKSDASIATLLEIPIGALIEVEGILVERGSRYLLIASSVRARPRAARAAAAPAR